MYNALKRITGPYLLFVLLLITTNVNSQVNKDSLLVVWNNVKLPDSTRLQALDVATWQGILFTNPDSGFYYAQLQYDFAKQVDNKKQMGNALNTQAVSYSMKGEYPTAIDYHKRSLKIRMEINDKYGIAKSYANMGPAYSNQGDIVSALDVYEKSLAISEPNNFVRLISISLNNIGVIYKSQKDHTKALEYFLQGLKLAREINNKRGEANTISNISTVYRDQGNLDSALVYANTGLTIFKEIGDIKGVAAAYESIGVLYFRKKEYNKAITFELKALKIREEINDKLGLASSMVNLGLAHIQMGQPKQGESWCEEGLEMAISVGSLPYKKSACECLSESSKAQGLWKEALEYNQKYMIYSDSLRTNETTRRLQQLEFAKQMVRDSIAREAKRLEAVNVYEAKVHRRNTLQYSGIAILLFILISWWFLARNLNLPEWLVELSLFVPFLIFFRFITILIGPYTSQFSNEEPFNQLLLTIVLAAFITPTHRFIEKKVRKRIFNQRQSDNLSSG